MGDKLCDVLA